MALIRWTPIAHLADVQEELNRLIDHSLRRTAGQGNDGNHAPLFGRKRGGQECVEKQLMLGRKLENMFPERRGSEKRRSQDTRRRLCRKGIIDLV